MKKNLLLVLMLIMSTAAMYAQINRQLVLLEIGTGTWCVYCPGAAMGADDLIANGDPVAVIENHNGDSFTTADSDARNSYYSISGYPTANFDGSYDNYVGGSNSQSMYNNYLPKVNARMGIQTNFTVELFGEHVGDNYNILVRLTQVGPTGGSSLKVRLALTESEIAFNWQGQSELNFVNRLMAPNAAGTSVSFTGQGDVVDVPLSFTFNNSWDINHCELVAFIQSDAGKENYHCEKVAIQNLQPLVAEANFSASADTICQGSTVSFTDLSGGDILSWNWTFEGGTPATSTDQNPVVSYNSTGIFDVSLIVTDANTSDTLTQYNLIEAIIEPAQPATAVGETQTCNGGTFEYTTQPVPYAEVYIWEASPSDAGTFIGSSIVGTFVADDSWTGDYVIRVSASNDCGVGLSSSDLNCTLNYSPLPFMMSNGGGLCAGDPGYEIILEGSETGIDYELFRDDVSTGNIMSGTGDALNFGLYSEEGLYSIVGFTATCETNMYGGTYIYLLGLPGAATTPAGPELVCSDASSDYQTTDITDAEEFIWTLDPAEAGTIAADGTQASIAWAANFSGEAGLYVQGSNICGLGTASDPLLITVNSSPAPVTQGPVEVCKNHQEMYATTDHPGNTYSWEVTGGLIIAGATSSEITVEWTTVGAGTVVVTETSTNGCVGIADILNITIDNCEGIESQLLSGFNLYPNPLKNLLTISFVARQGVGYKVEIRNQMGQKVWEDKSIATTGSQSQQIDLSSLSDGLYILTVTTANESWRSKIEINR